MYYKKGQEIELLNGEKRTVVSVVEFKDGKPTVVLVKSDDTMYPETVVTVEQIKQHGN